MSSRTEKTKSKPIAVPRPHLDPVLCGFVIIAAIVVIGRIAFAQGLAPAPIAAAADACSEAKLFGVPITDLINLGVPALIALYSIAWGMPKMQERFDKTLELERAANDKRYADIAVRLDRALDRGARAGD